MIKHEMENAFKLEVPLVVDLGMGKLAGSIKKQLFIKNPLLF
jgi:hypothetical protein